METFSPGLAQLPRATSVVPYLPLMAIMLAVSCRGLILAAVSFPLLFAGVRARFDLRAQARSGWAGAMGWRGEHRLLAGKRLPQGTYRPRRQLHDGEIRCRGKDCLRR